MQMKDIAINQRFRLSNQPTVYRRVQPSNCFVGGSNPLTAANAEWCIPCVDDTGHLHLIHEDNSVELVFKDDESPLSPKDYADALMVQDACNLSGVVFSFARVMQRVCNSEQGGTEARNKHAICRLFAEQIYHLSGGFDPESYTKAHADCTYRAG